MFWAQLLKASDYIQFCLYSVYKRPLSWIHSTICYPRFSHSPAPPTIQSKEKGAEDVVVFYIPLPSLHPSPSPFPFALTTSGILFHSSPGKARGGVFEWTDICWTHFSRLRPATAGLSMVITGCAEFVWWELSIWAVNRSLFNTYIIHLNNRLVQ